MNMHPEQRENEEFIGNAEKNRGHHPRYQNLKTIRTGEQAYCIKGTTKDMAHMIPLFVGKSEYAEYNRIWGESLRI